MRILVITDVLWRNDNGVGNSYSNIFAGMEDLTIANICCQEGSSDNAVSEACFQMSEGRLIANLRNRAIPAGIVEVPQQSGVVQRQNEGTSRIVRSLKRSRLQILFWMRNIIWKIGRWKSDALKNFVEEFKPDLIFAQLQDKMYLNDIVGYVQELTQCPLVLYAWDDVYSLKQFSLSPLYWIDRLMQRHSIRKLVQRCQLLYTISAEQKEEYARTLHVKTGLLYKGKNFEYGTVQPIVRNGVLQMLYTGNLYSGRYATLLSLCQELERQNESGIKAQLHIYSGTDLTDQQICNLNRGDSTFFEGRVSEQRVEELQNEADVLIHIEPLSLKGSLLCRLSFSTKLVDYFSKRKCIFAVGSERCASIRYLKRNDAALVSTSIEDAKKMLADMLASTDRIAEYSEKAWNCGAKNHQIHSIQENLHRELERMVRTK